MQFGWIVFAAAAVAFPVAGSVETAPIGAVSISAPSAPSAVKPRILATNLTRFEPLIGGRWIAEGELGGGRRYTAERRYEWLLDRRFVRLFQKLTVDGVTVEEEVTFGWDPAAGLLRMWSVASDGSFAEGAEKPAEGANRLVFEGRTVGGRTGQWRTTMLIIDPGSFSVLLEVRSDAGTYEPAMTLAYRRVADITPPADTTTAVDTLPVRRDTLSVDTTFRASY